MANAASHKRLQYSLNISDAAGRQQPCGYINGTQHTFTIDTGETQSIFGLDVVNGKCEVLNNVRLRTVTGHATVHGKTEVILTSDKSIKRTPEG